MKKKTYYLGLDMGTSSVGWAVTDKGYKLLRARGKDLWGIRKFEEAQSAAERRVNRTNRRRRQREVVRIGLLKNYFAEEIEKVDSDFLIRLDNSRYYPEDKDLKLNSPNGVFNDPEYTDKDYYAQYPTIYHLRKELIENANAPYDVRLVYLAVLNMFKHRGHFLLNGVSGDINTAEVEQIYELLVTTLEEGYDVIFPHGKAKELCEVLSDKDTGRKAKQERVLDLFKVTKSSKQSAEFIKCICGLKSDAKVMFQIESEEKISICFNDYSYNDNIPTLQGALGDDNYSVVEMMKQIYDYAALSAILKGYDYLSEARVDSYNKHHEDLVLLKKVYHKYKTQDEYDVMFRSVEKGTYGAYVNSVNSSDAKTSEKKYRRNIGGAANRSTELLYDMIKKALKGHEADKEVSYILDQIEKEKFLPKQLTGENGVIPNQVHKKELVKILNNAEEYLPFLKNVDESGLTVSERIIKLFAFQIPYYVGPTSNDSKTGWVVRKEEGQVLPWNIKDKIDLEATSAAFIENLIRQCTYLNNEKVMPKASLMYEEYCVLNEINNIRVNGERIEPYLKQKLYHDCFEKKNRVTKKDVCTFLYTAGAIKSENEVSGIDVNINNSLSSYHKMYAVFGEKIKEDSYRKIAEEIIYWGTIYGDSKDMFRAKLMSYVNNDILDKRGMKRILGYKFKDWGKFSKALLELQACDKNTGEMVSVIQAMRDNSLNFMELIHSDEFSFKEELENKQTKALKSLEEFELQDLDEFYFSAPVKRMIWQTVQVIREIEQVMGCAPERIFIEMTRSDAEKGDQGRKDSRGKKLLEAYQTIKDTEVHKWKDEIKAADTEGRLKSKKLYLYYMQMGRDMYTGKEIDLGELFDDNKYDIDHIYPRHYVKDDSLINNLVLVNKSANEHLKKDFYPVPEQIRNNPKVRQLWDCLQLKKLISDEKYNRLINPNPFTDKQMAGFIGRQLVETGQGTKGVADLMKELMPETTVVYSKASNVSEFRRNGLYKSRIVNEFHHAHDAYLNIVVGNVYYTKFTQNPLNFIQKEYAQDKKKYHYNLAEMYKWDVVRNGDIAWIAKNKEDEGTMRTVRNMLSKNTPIMTFMSYESKGALYNIQPISKYKAKANNYVPLKTDVEVEMDVTKYGGYSSLKPAYFIFIEHGQGKKRKKVFDVVPLYYAEKIKSESDLVEYCTKVSGYENVRIICSKLKKGSLIKLDGYFLYLAGMDSRKNVEFHNATNLCVENKYMNYIHNVEVSHNNGWLNKHINVDSNIKLYELLKEKHVNAIFSKNPKPIGKILVDGEEKFKALSVEEQTETLYKLLSISSIEKANVSLKEIGGPAENGRIRISGNMTDRDELLLIKQSVTGIYQTFVDLLSE